MTTEQDKEMAKYIYQIIRSSSIIMFSWGFSNPTIIENGLSFHVNGFIHQGIVKVIYNEGEDLFEVQLLTKENELKESIESIYFDQLVEVIDNHVEKVANYNEAVNKEYGFSSVCVDK